MFFVLSWDLLTIRIAVMLEAKAYNMYLCMQEDNNSLLCIMFAIRVLLN